MHQRQGHAQISTVRNRVRRVAGMERDDRGPLQKTPYVEVPDAAIMMDVMTGRALAQTDQPQPVGVWTAVFFSLAKIGKIIEGNLPEASKIVWCDVLE
jgi:hypothetical protein